MPHPWAPAPGLDPETAKLEAIFRPRSVAVIGASPKRESIGGRILHNLIDFGFEGEVFPVNPQYEVVHSMKCYPTIEAIPDAVDCAIIVIPRELVLEVAEACGRKGVRGLVVISAGFRELGPEGAALEGRLVEIVRRYGMRMVGPNCYGVVNTNPTVRLNATFSKLHPRRGGIAFMSQSGALGQVVLEHAERFAVGFSMIASVGNKANVSGNDLLQYWRDDPDTDVILLYLESFGNPRKFSLITRELTKRKPILAIKAGRTAAGARATVSHTGALAGLDIAVDALFEQCGILRVTTVEELLNLSVALSHQPIPRGDRVAIITNAGGPAVMATDAVVRLGLRMAELSEQTRGAMRQVLSPAASVHNPVDMVASGGPTQYRSVMGALLADPGVDALLVIYVPPLMIDTQAVLEAIAGVAATADKTILGSVMGAEDDALRASEALGSRRMPVYRFPEAAVEALAAAIRYRRWREREEVPPPVIKVERERVAEILRGVRGRGERQILGSEALEILDSYGIPVAPHLTASGAEAAVDCAARIGFPVAIKVAASEVLHKTEVGGVFLDLRNEIEVLRAYRELDRRIRERLGTSMPTPVLIEPMVVGGVETVMGMSTDPSFGPLLMFGIGGIYVEALKDVSFRILPISERDAGEMLEHLRGYPLLAGYRGAAPVDRKILEGCLLRLSQLAGDFPEIEEFDVNPFIASPEGQPSRAVDARFLLVPAGG